MKIAVSSVGKNKSDLLDMRFGRCKYFQIFNTENEEIKCIENKGAISSGGAGIVAAQQIIDEKVDVVITGNAGPNSFKLLNDSNIKIIKSGNLSVEKAIQEYKNGKLNEINTSAPAHNGMR